MTKGNHEVLFSPGLIAYFRGEVSKSLPFADFGFTGGYGQVRTALVEAVRDENWNAAHRFFAALAAETDDEFMS